MNEILSATEPHVTVELFGTARQRGGRAELAVRGRTVGDLLRAVGAACPGLREVLGEDGAISRRYLVSVDGARFVDDPAELVPAGGRLLVLGADAGG